MVKLLRVAAVVAMAASLSACLLISVERGPDDPAKAKPAAGRGV